MKRTISSVGFILLLFSTGLNAQVVQTLYRGGSLNVIPRYFTASGESRIFTYEWRTIEDPAIPIIIYGKDFNTIEKEFSIPKPKPGAMKAEYATISVDQLTLKFDDEITDKTYPSFLELNQINYDSIGQEHFIHINLAHIDTLLLYYNAFAQLYGDISEYQAINSPEVLAKILSFFKSRNDAYEYEMEGFYDAKRNICCYDNRYGIDNYFYDYDENDYKYPEDYYTIDGKYVYHITRSYEWTASIPQNYSLNWTPIEFSDLRDTEKNGEGFMWGISYSNFDEQSFYNNDDYSYNRDPFLTQTLFNSDDKYEYITYKYEVGDWTTIQDMYPHGTDGINYGISTSFYYDNHYYTLKDIRIFANNNQITTTEFDGNKLYLYRKQYCRTVNETGFKVLSDDGSVVFSYDSSPDAEEGVYVSFFTYNSRNYMYIYDIDRYKEAYNYSIYEITPNSTPVMVVNRVNQPFASANDGIINMFLDESHTNSNAALYNSAGQSVGSRYIKKGETNPSMNAVGLPDGIYNLVLERNGQQLSNQKMLIK